jgi:hypothetical protein
MDRTPQSLPIGRSMAAGRRHNPTRGLVGGSQSSSEWDSVTPIAATALSSAAGREREEKRASQRTVESKCKLGLYELACFVWSFLFSLAARLDTERDSESIDYLTTLFIYLKRNYAGGLPKALRPCGGCPINHLPPPPPPLLSSDCACVCVCLTCGFKIK